MLPWRPYTSLHVVLRSVGRARTRGKANKTRIDRHFSFLFIHSHFSFFIRTGREGRTDQPPKRGVGHDSTRAVQFAFDSGAPVLLLQDYLVSRVTLAGGNRLLDGHNHFLIGNQFAAGSVTTKGFAIPARFGAMQARLGVGGEGVWVEFVSCSKRAEDPRGGATHRTCRCQPKPN